MKFKKLIRKHTPNQDSVRNSSKAMRFIHHWLFAPNLWHLNRRSVAAGFSAGLFAAFLPIPAQMLAAILLCILLHGHVALAIVATWVTNPLTAAPLAFFSYKVGAFILGKAATAPSGPLSYDILIQEFSQLWQPFVLGSIVCGLILALISYIAIRIYWRSQVLQGWSKRKAQRLLKKPPHE